MPYSLESNANWKCISSDGVKDHNDIDVPVEMDIIGSDASDWMT